MSKYTTLIKKFLFGGDWKDWDIRECPDLKMSDLMSLSDIVEEQHNIVNISQHLDKEIFERLAHMGRKRKFRFQLMRQTLPILYSAALLSGLFYCAFIISVLVAGEVSVTEKLAADRSFSSLNLIFWTLCVLTALAHTYSRKLCRIRIEPHWSKLFIDYDSQTARSLHELYTKFRKNLVAPYVCEADTQIRSIGLDFYYADNAEAAFYSDKIREATSLHGTVPSGELSVVI